MKNGDATATLLATDPTCDSTVVIKTALSASFSASVRMRLEHEAHVLSRVRNRGIAPLLAFGSEGDQVYVVIPFVPGITLQERLRQGTLSVPETIALSQAILSALSTAHSLKVLHRDVKPANVIVNDGIPLREATLTDFGLTHSSNLNARVQDEWAGTAQYLSPEAAGLLDQEVTACSDLYSTGIVLFECLAGRPPFQGSSVGEVLRQHMTMQTQELRSLGLIVPRALAEVIQRLLRKDPRDRYQTADAVLADLNLIAEALHNGESDPSLVVGLHDRRQTLTEPAFVGRGRELGALLERAGDVWEKNIARYHIAASHYRLGDLSAAAAEARHIYQSGIEIGDIQASGIALDLLVRATGNVSAQALLTELQHERYDVQGSAQVKLAEGVRLFMLERTQEAVEFLDVALKDAEKTDVRNTWTFPLRTWLASALRRQAEKTSHWAFKNRTALLKRGRRVAAKAVQIARTFQTDLPHALREAGLIAAMQGSVDRARKHLDESLAVAERQGARFEHAQTLLARGSVGTEVGWPRAAEDMATARQALRALGADFVLDETQVQEQAPAKTATLSLVDRFDTVLDAGRCIASALSRKTVFNEVRDAAVRLLRGERCLLLQLQGDEPTAAAALRLEMMGRNNNLTDADEACAALEREVERLSEVLMDFAQN